LVSFSAGGGITFYSDPEKEYEESLLKVQAIIKVLSGVGE
jgi:para-aminobenzoate synthetase component 1